MWLPSSHSSSQQKIELSSAFQSTVDSKRSMLYKLDPNMMLFADNFEIYYHNYRRLRGGMHTACKWMNNPSRSTLGYIIEPEYRSAEMQFEKFYNAWLTKLPLRLIVDPDMAWEKWCRKLRCLCHYCPNTTKDQEKLFRTAVQNSPKRWMTVLNKLHPGRSN